MEVNNAAPAREEGGEETTGAARSAGPRDGRVGTGAWGREARGARRSDMVRSGEAPGRRRGDRERLSRKGEGECDRRVREGRGEAKAREQGTDSGADPRRRRERSGNREAREEGQRFDELGVQRKSEEAKVRSSGSGSEETASTRKRWRAAA